MNEMLAIGLTLGAVVVAYMVYLLVREGIARWRDQREFWKAWEKRERELDQELIRSLAWALRYTIQESRDTHDSGKR